MTDKVRVGKISRIRQGDIFKNVEFIEYAVEKEGIVEFSNIIFPSVIVLTQDCDLEQDYKVRWSKKQTSHDKKLFSVIVAPLYNAEHVFQGKHLEYLEMEMEKIKKSGTRGGNITKNQDPRYHYLNFPDDIPLPASVIDFKHYFTVNVEYLKRNIKNKFICNLAPLYRENLSQRFSSFLSRIGLP